MKRYNTIESLTEVVGDRYFTDIPQGKVFFSNGEMYEAILNKAVIMVIDKCKNSFYCLFDTYSEAKRMFNDL